MQAANTQLAKELGSMGDRGAIPDLINRGLIANTAGLPVDLVNTVLQSLGLGAEQPVGGSDSIRRALEYYGLSSETKRPMLETLTGLTPPKAVMGAARAAGQGAEAVGRAAAPVAGQAIENYLVRSGGVLPMTVYHGSPHKFDAFDMSKIGTGEGAQAYGHGLYFAEAPEVAKGYAQNVRASKPSTNFKSPDGRDVRLINGTDWYVGNQPITHDAATNLWLKAGNNQSNLYKVDLPDEQIAKMLDWDKPLSQQPQLKEPLDKFTAEYGLVQPSPSMTGKQYYQALEDYTANTSAGGVKRNVSEDVSGLLRQYGIPGIRYLDQGSRGHQVKLSIKGKPYQTDMSKFPTLNAAEQYAAKKAKEGFQTEIVQTGTSNFVVFDPKHMNIIGRE